VNPENVEKVKDLPTPENVKDVEKFLGFINYHRENIKDLAKIALSLHKLTGKKTVFEWNRETESAFQELKGKLVSAPVLAYLYNEDPYILDTDASDSAIGAELIPIIQVQGGKEHDISYGSYVMTPEQCKYCTKRKELLNCG
jgi:hypothetical protein